MATDGGGSNLRSLMVPRIHATVPSPPAARILRRLHAQQLVQIWSDSLEGLAFPLHIIIQNLKYGTSGSHLFRKVFLDRFCLLLEVFQGPLALRLCTLQKAGHDCNR